MSSLDDCSFPVDGGFFTQSAPSRIMPVDLVLRIVCFIYLVEGNLSSDSSAGIQYSATSLEEFLF